MPVYAGNGTGDITLKVGFIKGTGKREVHGFILLVQCDSLHVELAAIDMDDIRVPVCATAERQNSTQDSYKSIHAIKFFIPGFTLPKRHLSRTCVP